MKTDIIVLGAGIVGISVAIHLARRGKAVVLLDRREPGEETSFGNAGLIQREGVYPRNFPREPAALLGYAGNRNPAMHYHPTALPGLASFLVRYWWHSSPARYAAIVERYAPLIAHSISEHADLVAASGAQALIGKDGWAVAFRTEAARDAAFAEADTLARKFAIANRKLNGAEMARFQPAISARLAGGLHWTDPWTVNDPSALAKLYANYFRSLGGTLARGDAMTLKTPVAGAAFQVKGEAGPIEADEVVIALGPWSGALTRKLGYKLPLAVKRGYHMHYAPVAGHTLDVPVLDTEPGYLLAPMTRGIRLTTGIEFAALAAPKTPVQLWRAEAIAKKFVPLGDRLDAEPWMGARPATPDMMPIIGRAPRHEGIWLAFGHSHHGLTLGPVTGRLLAEEITGAKPVIDPTPYRAERFRP